MSPPGDQIPSAADAPALGARGEVRGDLDLPFVLVQHIRALVLAPVASRNIGIASARLADIGGLSLERQFRRRRRIDLRPVHDGVLNGIPERQIRVMLAGELSPPARHQVVGRPGGIPAHQGIGHRRAVVVVLEECPVPCPVAGDGGRSGPLVDGIVGRVDGDLAAVLERKEHPKPGPGELAVPLELDSVVGGRGRIVAAGAGARDHGGELGGTGARPDRGTGRAP